MRSAWADDDGLHPPTNSYYRGNTGTTTAAAPPPPPLPPSQDFMPTHYATAASIVGPSSRSPSAGAPTGFGGGGYLSGGSASNVSINASSGGAMDPSASASSEPAHRTRFGHPEDDLPLLEELGVHPAHIKAKAYAVLHPMKAMRADVMQDPDLAGPVALGIALGLLLSLQGKVQFSAVYALSLLGTGGFRALLGVMSEPGVSVSTALIVSTLGYCLIPNIILAALQTAQVRIIGSHKGVLPLAMVAVAWAAWCACMMFAKAYSMEHQRYLILYPLVLFYSVFAALTIF